MLKVGDGVHILATSQEFAYSTQAQIMDLGTPIHGQVMGINEDGTVDVTAWDHMGYCVDINVNQEKPDGEGWYLVE